MRTYSSFWLAYAIGLIALSPAFAERDAPEAMEESIDMRTWLRLPEAERNNMVEAYAQRRPRAMKLVHV